MVQQTEFYLPKFHKGYHLITDIVLRNLPQMPNSGILNLFIHHTSAAITINENADASVRDDFESFFNKLIPENDPCYTHIYEGADDMPAHIKASVIGQSLSIPISNQKLKLGTWQGIYFCEFRTMPSNRQITATVFS